METKIIQKRIIVYRDAFVMLDSDLAALYNVSTKVLKQAVKRNMERFPSDFLFVLTQDEYRFLRSQFVTLDEGSGRGQHSKYGAYAFTEQGVAMLCSVLRSPKAIETNISIVRAFVMFRHHLSDFEMMKKKIAELEREMNRKFRDVNEALHFLAESGKVQEQIGFRQSGRDGL